MFSSNTISHEIWWIDIQLKLSYEPGEISGSHINIDFEYISPIEICITYAVTRIRIFPNDDYNPSHFNKERLR